MPYQLGKQSRQRLAGVHPDLRVVVERAIQISKVDFTVLETLRTLERQRSLVAAGSSTTMKSRHLTGHAVDLGAWIDNAVDWSWPLYYKIAEAMKQAAEELAVSLERVKTILTPFARVSVMIEGSRMKFLDALFNVISRVCV
ncbi:M15 family metallopeptidase [Aliamphritea hakodatensis]|uniref:M15 family metallopeptidase n=1 Tax=Aliamphritea hakodatensis TaxID=2895352 RepID=UPI0022FDAAFD|nr:M15 family metallopeptidase [Aliamphritea hakodatensis]